LPRGKYPVSGPQGHSGGKGTKSPPHPLSDPPSSKMLTRSMLTRMINVAKAAVGVEEASDSEEEPPVEFDVPPMVQEEPDVTAEEEPVEFHTPADVPVEEPMVTVEEEEEEAPVQWHMPDDVEEAEPRMVQQEPMTFEIDDFSEPPVSAAVVPARSNMTPSLWQAGNGMYKDKYITDDDETFTIVYDYPRKRTDRNHLVMEGALMFLKKKSKSKAGIEKSKAGWCLAGKVEKVLDSKYYPHDQEQKWALLLIRKEAELREPCKNKNDAIAPLGFRPLSDFERMHGLIPLYKK
jgi:hypothetical protein